MDGACWSLSRRWISCLTQLSRRPAKKGNVPPEWARSSFRSGTLSSMPEQIRREICRALLVSKLLAWRGVHTRMHLSQRTAVVVSKGNPRARNSVWP